MWRLSTSKNSAWRAVYIHSGSPLRAAPLRFSIGIDPCGPRPHLFGAVGWRRDCTGERKAAWHWRIPLPAWRWIRRLDGRRYGPLRRLDGKRYGD